MKRKLSVPVIIEVNNLKEFEQVVESTFVTRVLLDNFSPDELKEIVVVNHGRKILEASGGITENNIVKFAASGVDFISVGQITHHIQSIDISLKIK